MAIPYWRLSGFYFFYFSTLGGFLPYWSLFLEHNGFKASEIGELIALLTGTKIIAPNIWGWIADQSGKSLYIIRLASLAATVLFSGFLLHNSFLWFAWMTVLFSFFWNACLPQFEAATLFHLRHDSHRYSSIRLWGSVGFIVSVLGIGRILDSWDITVLPYILIVALSMIWLMSLFTPDADAMHHKKGDKQLLQIVRQPKVLAFLAVYILLQVSHGPYYVFYSLYLQAFDYSTSVTGLLWGLGVFAEVVLFIFMRPLLQKVSLRSILLLSLFLTVCRWNLIAWGVEHLWLLIAAQILHAASFGAAHVSAIHLVHDYFGMKHQGKGQALYSSMSFGLGGMLGSFGSGMLWESYGAHVVYTLSALIAWVAFMIAILWVGKHKNQAL